MMRVGLRKTEQFRRSMKLPEILHWLCRAVETFWKLLGESLKGPVTERFLRGVPIRTVSNLNEQLDLNRLRKRLREKPRTKAGQVRQAWPDIRDLLAAGHSLKDVWAWLNEIGLQIGYARLSDYIGQLRRRDKAAQLEVRESKAEPSEAVEEVFTQTRPPVRSEARGSALLTGGHGKERDPLASVLERESKQPGFNYNEEPDRKKLI